MPLAEAVNNSVLGLQIGEGIDGVTDTAETGLLTVRVELVLVTPLLQMLETMQEYIPVTLDVKVLTVDKLLTIEPLLAH